MKRRLSIGLSILAVAVAVPLVGGTPVLANLQQAGETLVKKIFQPQVKLVLSAQKQVVITNAKGQPEKTWQALAGEVTVQPGDVLRYTLVSENTGDKAASELKVTQPIPAKTTYILASSQANGAKLTYSIDGGQTFTAKPMVKVTKPDGTVEMQPAPAEAYTHVRWDYSESIQPMAAVQAVYQVTVN